MEHTQAENPSTSLESQMPESQRIGGNASDHATKATRPRWQRLLLASLGFGPNYKNWMRLSAFMLCVTAIAIGVVAYKVRAATTEVLSNYGLQMMRYSEVLSQDGDRSLVFNGQRIGIGSGRTTHNVQTVLDHFAGKCREHSAGFRAEIEESIRNPEFRAQAANLGMLDGVVRENLPNGRGYVACIDMGTQRRSMGDLMTRLTRFAETKDFADLGGVRYAYAEPTNDGEHFGDVTHFLVTYSNGKLDLDEMFPERGDAPGVDVEGVPRPEASTRLVSAWEAGHPQAVVMYNVPNQTPAQLIPQYQHVLEEGGWNVLDPHRTLERAAQGRLRGRDSQNPAEAFVAERGNRMVTVTFAAGARNQGSTLTVFQTR